MNNLPIGVFDSGIGGLTVLDALIRTLPQERFLYFGDTARLPYGNKSSPVIIDYSRQIARFLLHGSASINALEKGRHIKMLVIACNTASALAAPTLEKELPIPIIGVVEAGARQAAKWAGQGTIAVIGTKSTINSSVYAKHLKRLAPKAKITTEACPLFVPLVEEGWLDHPVTDQVVQIYLEKINAQKPDVLILGCTHYPMLQETIAKSLHPGAKIVDSPTAVAQEVQKRLKHLRLNAANPRARAPVQFFVSDDPQGFHRSAKIFLNRPLPGPVRLIRL